MHCAERVRQQRLSLLSGAERLDERLGEAERLGADLVAHRHRPTLLLSLLGFGLSRLELSDAGLCSLRALDDCAHLGRHLGQRLLARLLLCRVRDAERPERRGVALERTHGEVGLLLRLRGLGLLALRLLSQLRRALAALRVEHQRLELVG